MKEFLKSLNLAEEVSAQILSKIEGDYITKTAYTDFAKKAEERFNAQKGESERILNEFKKNHAIEMKLQKEGAKSLKALKPFLADFAQNAQMDEKGDVAGLDDFVKSLKEDAESSFLFGCEKIAGAVPANPPKVKSKPKEAMTYDELCEYFKEKEF